MKRTLSLTLALLIILTFAGAALAADSFVFDNFDGRDPKNKPDLAPNGANMWWDNWANLKSSVDNGVLQLQYKPKAYDKEDYDTLEEYYAAAADWMGNWGEAIDMWSLDGIQWCKYLNIRVKGAEGGEEKKLIMDWHPEDSKFFAVRFSDLVLKDGSKAKITKEWQTLTIDLEKSGFPGMTNALHIRAFADCTIFLDDITFTDPVGAIVTTSKDTIMAGISVKESGKPGDLPIKQYIADLSAPATTTANPKTGDNGYILIAVITLILSAGAFTILKVRKSRA